jgi:hypothetical protein
MQRVLVVIAICGFLCAMPLFAADDSKAEIFGGYRLVHDEGVTLNGFTGALEANVNKAVGIVGDFGYTMKSGTPNNLNEYTFMGGPRFSYRADKFRVFAHALVGDVTVSMGSTKNNFGMAFGGGLDFSATDKISIRPVQFDLMTVRASAAGASSWGNQIRYSAGVVFKLGSKK